MIDSSDSPFVNEPVAEAAGLPDDDPSNLGAPASPFAAPAESLCSRSPFAEVPQRPRIWTALVAALIGIGIAPLVSTFALITVLAVEAARQNPTIAVDPQQWLNDFVTTRIGLLVMVLPIQLAVGGLACAGALLSPEPFFRRLSLVRGRYHYVAWIVFALSTPVVGFLTSIVVSLFLRDLGETLERIQQLFGGHTGPFVIVVAVLIAVVPGCCEELLFRGYVQSRLLKRLPALAAIVISAGAFSFAHFHPVHSLVVFPLGVWLGVVAWRAESIWPSILGHVVNNFSSLMLSQLASQSDQLANGLAVLAIAGLSGVCLMFSCILLFAGQGPVRNLDV